MRKTSILALFITLSSIQLHSQDYKNRFNFEPTSLQQIRTLEKSYNSADSGFRKVNVSKDYFRKAEEKKDYYPLVYHWTTDIFSPNCFAEYFYFNNDSIAKVVVYNWNILNYITNLKVSKSLIIEQTKRSKEYLKQYNAIYQIVLDKYGKPTTEEKIKKSEKGYFGNAKWEKNGTIVELYYSFTPELQKMGEFVFGTFRIRLKIDNN